MADDTSRVLTLVFTDLADSTALKSQHGDQAVDELMTRHREHVARIAEECAGRVIDWAGDGCFLTFDTSSAGVMFALRVQQAHANDPDLPRVRIGIHLGEVTEKDGPGGTIYVKGLAVDLASRIQGLAKPGQVLMSSAVYHSARQRLGVEAFGAPILWQAHGAYALKGFNDPLEIGEAGLEGLSPLMAPEASEKAQPLVVRTPEVEVIPPPRRGVSKALVLAVVVVLLSVVGGFYYFGRDKAPATPPVPVGQITSLAVLPLENLSNDPEQDYFADGMTEAIIAELAKIKSLKVISRTSVMAYKNSDRSLPEIASNLGVEGIIEGSVLRDGNDIRITVQLIHGPSDTHLWSENYTNTLTSVLKLQSDVALAVADAMRAELTGAERQRIATATDLDPEAIEAHLLGKHLLWNGVTKRDFNSAIDFFSKGVALEPAYADAWALLGQTYLSMREQRYLSNAESIPKAREAFVRAVELDAGNPYGQSGLANITYLFDHQWLLGRERLERALELNPNAPILHEEMMRYGIEVGDKTLAQRHADRAVDLDPENPVLLSWAALAYSLGCQDLNGAAKLAERAMVLDSDSVWANWAILWVEIDRGDFETALNRAQYRVQLTNRSSYTLLDLADVYAFAGDTKRAREILYNLIDEGNVTDVESVAKLYVKLREFDKAFEWFTRAIAADEAVRFKVFAYHPAYLKLDGIEEFLTDPRYWRLIDQMNFPPFPPDHPGYKYEQAWLARKAAAAEANAPIKRLAVLPFTNMMNDPEQEYFVDGMTEALITELAQIRSIQVRGRTSVMRYKDTDKSIPEIARELNVDGIIEGSVLREGDEVRITAQLIHAPSDTHRWAESFDSTVTSILKLHSEMALAIAREVEANLTPQEESRIAEAREVNPAAYDQVLLARQAGDRQSPEGFKEAERHARQAVAIDPEFADALSVLAESLWVPTIWGWGDSAEPIGEVKAILARAQELDPNSAAVLRSTAWVALVYDHDWSRAWDLFQRAVELEPNNFWHHNGLAWCHQAAGEIKACLDEAMLQVELNPYSAMARDAVGDAYSNMGQIEKAIAYRKETLEIHPDHVGTLINLANDYAALGRDDDWAQTFQRLEDLGSAQPAFRARHLARLGRSDEARALLAKVEASDEYTYSIDIAITYALLGDADKMFEWLNRAYDDRNFDVILIGTKAFPQFDPYRDDSRFQAILKKMNFPTPRAEYQ